jgi:hypothetical protein
MNYQYSVEPTYNICVLLVCESYHRSTWFHAVAAREVMYWGFTVKKYIHDVNVLF